MRMRTKAIVLTCFLSGIVISGCATINDLAPQINDTTVRLGAMRKINADQLEQGRSIYLTQCARCHSPEPVTRYSLQQWNTILPRMCDKAELNQSERAMLAAYVEIVLEAERQSNVQTDAEMRTVHSPSN